MYEFRLHACAHLTIWCFVEYPSARPHLYMTNKCSPSLPIPHTGIITVYGRVVFPILHFYPAECVGSHLWILARWPDASAGQFCSAWHTTHNFPLLPRPSVMMGEGYGILVQEMADYVLTGSRSKLQANTERGIKERREREGKTHSPTTVMMIARWRVGEGKWGGVSCPSTLDSPGKWG